MTPAVISLVIIICIFLKRERPSPVNRYNRVSDNSFFFVSDMIEYRIGRFLLYPILSFWFSRNDLVVVWLV
jgi:hypothetical protein